MENFQKLNVWQEAKRLAVDMYALTSDFPSNERFGLVNQMRRAAVSVSSNIAEGSKKASSKDRLRFHSMAESSLEELKSQALIARELGFIAQGACDGILEQARKVGGMLGALNKTIAKT